MAQNWNKDISEEELKEWTETGKSIGTAMDNKIMEEFTAHYVFLMRKVSFLYHTYVYLFTLL